MKKYFSDGRTACCMKVKNGICTEKAIAKLRDLCEKKVKLTYRKIL